VIRNQVRELQAVSKTLRAEQEACRGAIWALVKLFPKLEAAEEKVEQAR